MMRLLLVFALATPVVAGELAGAERQVVRAAKEARAAVVTVYTPNKKDFDVTGVVIASKGIILTLRKPLLSAAGSLPAAVAVRFPGRGKTVMADVIDDDRESGTVLLQARKVRATPMRSRRSDDTRLGMWVLLVGNQFGTGRESTPTVSLGVVSGLVRTRDRVSRIHASTLVNPGSFGAPVLDLSGGLLGITALAWTKSGGQSVVIPVDYVRQRYRDRKGPGAKFLTNPPRKRGKSTKVTDLFGVVMEAAALRARTALVGVRSGAIPADTTVAKKKEEPAEGEKKKKKRVPRKPPQPRRVPGVLEAYDRCSGVIVSTDGLIVCPLRITGWPGPERPLTVDLPNGTAVKAQVRGRDERLRIALLAVDVTGLTVLEPCPEADLRTGRFVLALGYPHDDPAKGTAQVTFGVLSRTEALRSLHPAIRALQTDAAVAGGNRGGPLVDMEGRLMGVLLDVNDTDGRGYFSRARGSYFGNAGLGFAVPLHVLRDVMPKLKKGGLLRSPYLGVGTEPVEGGIRVRSVGAKNSKGDPTTAARAGLKVGDVIVSIAGSALTQAQDLRRTLMRFTVGDEVEIVYTRAGKRVTIKVTLGER